MGGVHLLRPELWCRNVEVFSIVFGLFGRLRRCSSRPTAVTAGPSAARRRTADTHAARSVDDGVHAAGVGTVTVDGLMETPAWAAVVEV